MNEKTKKFLEKQLELLSEKSQQCADRNNITGLSELTKSMCEVVEKISLYHS